MEFNLKIILESPSTATAKYHTKIFWFFVIENVYLVAYNIFGHVCFIANKAYATRLSARKSQTRILLALNQNYTEPAKLYEHAVLGFGIAIDLFLFICIFFCSSIFR